MEILNKLQKSILKIFPGVKNNEKFYLTGGPALAMFFLKHRLSEDLEFFTAEENLVTFFAEDLTRVFLYEALKTKKMDLVKVIRKAKEKGPGLEEYFLALSFQKIEKFPDDIKDIPVKMLKPVDFKKVKNFFLENAVKLLDKGK